MVTTIGILGTGRMAVRLAVEFAKLGHSVVLGSRTPERATYIARGLGQKCIRPGDYHAAAAAEVVLPAMFLRDGLLETLSPSPRSSRASCTSTSPTRSTPTTPTSSCPGTPAVPRKSSGPFPASPGRRGLQERLVGGVRRPAVRRDGQRRFRGRRRREAKRRFLGTGRGDAVPLPRRRAAAQRPHRRAHDAHERRARPAARLFPPHELPAPRRAVVGRTGGPSEGSDRLSLTFTGCDCRSGLPEIERIHAGQEEDRAGDDNRRHAGQKEDGSEMFPGRRFIYPALLPRPSRWGRPRPSLHPPMVRRSQGHADQPAARTHGGLPQRYPRSTIKDAVSKKGRESNSMD